MNVGVGGEVDVKALWALVSCVLLRRAVACDIVVET